MERGPNDLEERIEMLEKQKKFMQNKLREAGARIKDLEEINNGSNYRIADLENINESHQKLNGELQARVKRLEKLLQEYEDKNVC